MTTRYCCTLTILDWYHDWRFWSGIFNPVLPPAPEWCFWSKCEDEALMVSDSRISKTWFDLSSLLGMAPEALGTFTSSFGNIFSSVFRVWNYSTSLTPHRNQPKERKLLLELSQLFTSRLAKLDLTCSCFTCRHYDVNRTRMFTTVEVRKALKNKSFVHINKINSTRVTNYIN